MAMMQIIPSQDQRDPDPQVGLRAKTVERGPGDLDLRSLTLPALPVDVAFDARLDLGAFRRFGLGTTADILRHRPTLHPARTVRASNARGVSRAAMPRSAGSREVGKFQQVCRCPK